RSFPRGMVLAAGRDCKLFGRTLRRRPRRDRLARHALGNGNGGGVIDDFGRTDFPDLVRGRQAHWRRRQGARRRISALRRRFHLVGRSGQGAACAEEAAVLNALNAPRRWWPSVQCDGVSTSALPLPRREAPPSFRRWKA